MNNTRKFYTNKIPKGYRILNDGEAVLETDFMNAKTNFHANYDTKRLLGKSGWIKAFNWDKRQYTFNTAALIVIRQVNKVNAKKLSDYNVVVSNRYEHDVATTFYRMATKKGMCAASCPNERYVGVSKNPVYPGICCGLHYTGEKNVNFNQIATLADTDFRKECLQKALNRFAKQKPSVRLESLPKREVGKATGVSKKLPLMAFSYPRKNQPLAVSRKIRVVKADPTYIIGFDVGDSNRFKKFLRSKIVGNMILESFND